MNESDAYHRLALRQNDMIEAMPDGFGDRNKLALTGLGLMALMGAAYVGGNYARRPATIGMESNPAGFTAPAPVGQIIVHVSGSVKKPGVYKLSPQARVSDALKVAGGASRTADMSQVNLAEALSDGTKVHIPALGEDISENPGSPMGFVSSGSSSNSSKSPVTGSISLNSASQADLETLPGIGPATAQKILAYRQQIGRFQSIEQLLEVIGIGPKKMEKLRPHVRL